jgi:YD repeat-containing protein
VTKSPASGLTTVYHYDSAGHLIAESDAQGNVQTEYIYLGDMPVAVIQ